MIALAKTFSQRVKVGTAKFAALFAAAQKRRVADDCVAFGLLRFAAVFVEQSISVRDAVERSQNQCSQ
jgi:hypothetical protein